MRVLNYEWMRLLIVLWSIPVLLVGAVGLLWPLLMGNLTSDGRPAAAIGAGDVLESTGWFLAGLFLTLWACKDTPRPPADRID